MILDTTLPSRSGRIALVPPHEDDDVAVAALRSHPEIRRYLPFFPESVSVEDARALRLARTADETRISFNLHALSADAPTKFVGTVGISHINTEFKSCEIGVLISPDCFRGGFATDALYAALAYAFEQRKFHRAAFLTAKDNAGMRGWLEKAGATLDATQRECRPDDIGGFADWCLYSILERDWVNTVKLKLEARIDRISGTREN
ncbi:acyl-CoA N-acyltransferase [Mycena crocata]|nr:acyl-CoA N-acyltransferase [Mycena crocata]